MRKKIQNCPCSSLEFGPTRLKVVFCASTAVSCNWFWWIFLWVWPSILATQKLKITFLTWPVFEIQNFKFVFPSKSSLGPLDMKWRSIPVRPYTITNFEDFFYGNNQATQKPKMTLLHKAVFQIKIYKFVFPSKSSLGSLNMKWYFVPVRPCPAADINKTFCECGQGLWLPRDQKWQFYPK